MRRVNEVYVCEMNSSIKFPKLGREEWSTGELENPQRVGFSRSPCRRNRLFNCRFSTRTAHEKAQDAKLN